MLSGAKVFLQTFILVFDLYGLGQSRRGHHLLHNKCNDDGALRQYHLSCSIHLTGSDLTLPEHVARQAGVKRVTVHEARGRLIAGLDILARAWLCWSNRISEICFDHAGCADCRA